MFLISTPTDKDYLRLFFILSFNTILLLKYIIALFWGCDNLHTVYAWLVYAHTVEQAMGFIVISISLTVWSMNAFWDCRGSVRVCWVRLTDRDAIGMPVSSTGPIPENFIKRSSRVAEVLGNVAEPPLWIPPLDNPTERVERWQLKHTWDCMKYRVFFTFLWVQKPLLIFTYHHR